MFKKVNVFVKCIELLTGFCQTGSNKKTDKAV